MKKIFFIFLSFSLLIACKNVNRNNHSNIPVVQDSILTLTTDEFLANPAGYVDQKVIVTGMVAHVCRHGGQKLFLVSTATNKYLRINTGNTITEFPIDLEGSNIKVKGVVAKFELDAPVETSSEVVAENEIDTSHLEKAYHKDNYYVVMSESYSVSTE